MVRVVVALFVLMMMPSAVQARHVYIAVETTLLYEQGRFVGLRHKWTFDKLYSEFAIEGLDTNKDGRYDRSELAELAERDMQSLKKDFNYYTLTMFAGQPLKVGEARDYWLEHKDGELSLHFTLPFETPVPTVAKGLTFSVYDRSSYITFDFATTERSVRLGEGSPAGCAWKVIEPVPGAIPIPGPWVVSVECDGS